MASHVGPRADSNQPALLAERLSAVRLFAGLSPLQLAQVAAVGEVCQYAEEETLLRQGDPALFLHALLRGRVKVSRRSSRGRTQTLLVLGPGDVLGEAAVLSGGCYPASAQALEACETFCLARDSFLELVRRDPEVGMRLLGTLASRLQAFVCLVEDLALRDVTERLAAHLLGVADATESEGAIVLPVSKRELAGLLGTVPETLSRAFKQLCLAGVLETRGKKVWIRDRRLLERLTGADGGRIEG